MERMTPEEFNAKETEILARVPEEFRSAISWLAYDRGHAYGYEEVLSHVSDLVASFEEPIKLYTQRIGMEASS